MFAAAVVTKYYDICRCPPPHRTAPRRAAVASYCAERELRVLLVAFVSICMTFTTKVSNVLDIKNVRRCQQCIQFFVIWQKFNDILCFVTSSEVVVITRSIGNCLSRYNQEHYLFLFQNVDPQPTVQCFFLVETITTHFNSLLTNHTAIWHMGLIVNSKYRVYTYIKFYSEYFFNKEQGTTQTVVRVQFHVTYAWMLRVWHPVARTLGAQQWGRRPLDSSADKWLHIWLHIPAHD